MAKSNLTLFDTSILSCLTHQSIWQSTPKWTWGCISATIFAY